MDTTNGYNFPSYYHFALLITVVILYWVFYVPCNWKKRIDDVGYQIALEGEGRVNSLRKRDAINRIRKLRQIGIKDLPPPYPNGWYCILESHCLRRGEAKHVSVLGEQLVVFRTLNSTVYVLNAYCPHLGANIGMGGKVIGDTIECPFHKWSFRGSDGRCVNVPYSSCVPLNSKLQKWISREVNDNIFIWYSVDSDQVPWDIPTIATNKLAYHGRNEFYINCHIQEIPENGADLAHFRAIHDISVLAGGKIPNDNFLKGVGTHKWEAIWTPSATKHIALLTLKHSLSFTEQLNFIKMDITGQQIGPSYVHLRLESSMGRIDILQTVTPVGPMTQKVVHRFYGLRILAPFIKGAIFAESIMFERDIAMWNHKIFRKRPQLVKEDSSILAFRNWYQQFYSENSRTFYEAKECLEW